MRDFELGFLRIFIQFNIELRLISIGWTIDRVRKIRIDEALKGWKQTCLKLDDLIFQCIKNQPGGIFTTSLFEEIRPVTFNGHGAYE